MSYRETRWPKIVVGTVAAGLLVTFVGAPRVGTAKEWYFNYVAESCSETHGLARIPWQWVPAFDASVERFVANSDQENAVLDCIDRWAGVIISDRVSGAVSHPTIEFTVSGSNLASFPPPRFVSYDYIRPAD